MSSEQAIMRKQQAIANNIFVRRVREYENYKEYQKYNKSRYDTYEEERYYINEKVKRDMTKCACNDNTDYSDRCNPMDLRFRICPMRVETANWFISNEYAKIEDFYYLNDEDKDEIEFYMTVHQCDVCGSECSYYQDDIRGECGTSGCCKILCSSCGYCDGGDYYCKKCHDKMIENGFVDWEEQ